MGKYSQDDRPFRVNTGLGKDALLLQGFSGEEGVSVPFAYTLDLLSEGAAVDAGRLLRTPVTLTLALPGGGERVIHGLMNRFSQAGQIRGGELTTYRAQVVPWLWFLSLSSNCKIFQNMSVLEIVEQVFRARGYSDFEVQCVKPHPKREYCVQYRETDLNFISRLLEEEGVFYFFRHTESKHSLVLADDNSAVKPCAAQSTVKMATEHGGWVEEDVVMSLQREQIAQVGKVTLRDYDYLQPSLSLESSVTGRGTEEVYDYPGTFTTLDDGERLARLQLDEREGWQLVVRGESSCRGLEPGGRFDLKEHYRSDANDSYLLLHLRQTGRCSAYWDPQDASVDYRNSFVAIPHKVPFRPPRTAPKPVVQGSQTALVVGKAGEEIWVDKYGRVKVQFYWDRDGRKDENSSCWVRVASAWAGKQWGHIQIPRIGQEVIVDFLEGDPDLPIITGRVYNAEQMPPYELPANQTRSGVKSRSSKGGSADTCNEIRFEDKKGSEEVYLQAEKDFAIKVKNDEQRTVLHDRSAVVKNHDTRTVQEGNDTTTVEKGDQAVTVKQGKQEISVDQGDQVTTIKMGKQVVTLNQGDRQVTLKMGSQTTKADMGDITVKAALGKVAVEAMQGIELKVGQSTVKVDQTGVTIKGLMLKLEGQVQTEVKGVMTTVKGDGMLMVKGGVAMIN
jgi:type VI secretion system secreted protein VgrG